ncbi:contractile injection system protein, VgrG/Pvc8 family [Neptuniibacter sp. CAU 1671]|uniref:contractile injection system protein, VgrG/Pvc8 family n=1 Tax=Neptuniibacter sp. CAU 1671 TaxID=3032593 RepID=UPI0023DC1A97|nr:contractile injection system protein, VgrG/Pvc8 family [Neptuniibacter sp. CAU 1671]MDF2180962.1 contractile injection system protein, VgrG/Pvc8 family [Neptuniibacter sp. CAU 1671]
MDYSPSGVTIKLWLGWLGQLEYKRQFEVDEITHTGNPAVLSITARSADFKGDLKKKREQSYHLVKLGDLLTTLAKRNNLVPAIEQQLADKFIDHLDQTNESDLNLITRLGQRYGALHSIKAGRLLFKLAGRGDTVGGSEIPAVTLKRSHGDNHTFTQTDRAKPTTPAFRQTGTASATQHSKR